MRLRVRSARYLRLLSESVLERRAPETMLALAKTALSLS